MYKQQTNIDKSKIISTLVKIFVCPHFLNNQIGKIKKLKLNLLDFKPKNEPFSAIPESSTLLTSTKLSSQPLSLFCPERERENHISEKKKGKIGRAHV